MTDTKTTSGTWASVDFRKVRDGGWAVVWVNKWMSDRYQDNKWYVGQRGLQEGKGRWVGGCVGEQMDGWTDTKTTSGTWAGKD